MRNACEYIGDRVKLPAGATRLQLLRRLDARGKAEYPQTEQTKVQAMAAGREEAAEASRVTGFDYTAAYERMCQLLADWV